MLEFHSEGVLVHVWVVAGASRNEVVGTHGGALKVRVSAAPEGGKANRAVAALVVEAVGGTAGSVVAGAASRRKQIVVSGVSPGEAAIALGLSSDEAEGRLRR